MQKLGAPAKGKGASGTNATQYPLEHVQRIRESNNRTAHALHEWLQLAASGINVAVLERARKTATVCIPVKARRAVDDALNIRMDMIKRMADLTVQLNNMGAEMHLEANSFTDGTGKRIDPSLDYAVTKALLMDGNLRFGGTTVRSVVFLNKEAFRQLIFEKHEAIAEDWPVNLTYGNTDASFSMRFNTDSGAFDVRFHLGVDGRPEQPRVFYAGGGDGDGPPHELRLLESDDMEKLAGMQARMVSRSAFSSSGSRRPR